MAKNKTKTKNPNSHPKQKRKRILPWFLTGQSSLHNTQLQLAFVPKLGSPGRQSFNITLYPTTLSTFFFCIFGINTVNLNTSKEKY
jgi:hypothetical protein